jgi:cob(I)alamin adenosyltransferase
MIQVYTGDGKGKTTAALGLAIRAMGHGKRVIVVQFMKGWEGYGELVTAKKIGLPIERFGRRELIDPDRPEEIDFKLARDCYDRAIEIIDGKKCDLLIIDEINVALKYGLLELEDVMDLIDRVPSEMEVVLTGRYAHPEVVERADLVTEMVEIKHPFKKGVKAREGVEF